VAGVAVHEKSLPAEQSNPCCGFVLAIAQDHHHSIVLLGGASAVASSFALLRSEFEAYAAGNGSRIAQSDAQVEKYLGGWELQRSTNCLLP